MINLIIEDGKQTEKARIKINKRERKYRFEMFMAAMGTYLLIKTVMKHDRDIASIKKVIEEMKSKGE